MTSSVPQSGKSKGGLPPGPRGRFLVGNTVELARNWMGFITRCAHEYGDVVYLRFFNVPICLLVHPDAIEHVLVTNQSNFVKSRDYRALASVLGNGLLTSEGALWRVQRKLMQPAFHHENILSYGRVMVEHAARMLVGWHDGETRNVHEDMMSLTLQIVADALFGADVSNNAQNVGDAMRVVMEQFITHANLAFLLPERLPLPSTFRLRRAVRRLDDIIYAIVRERRAATSPPADLLSVLLHAQGEDGTRMTDAQLRDEVMTLFLAGHETTAIALSWAWYLLALYPDAEARLTEELTSVLGGRPPAPEDLPSLRYSEMIVKEALRLYPPAWGVGREALADFEVGGYQLPAGTNVFIAQWITQRDARFFPEPQRFDPSRWEDDPIRRGAAPCFAYFPFGGGPRMCIGASFAMMEATLLLATIAQRFRMSLADGHPVEMLPSITLRPKHGVRVVLHSRC